MADEYTDIIASSAASASDDDPDDTDDRPPAPASTDRSAKAEKLAEIEAQLAAIAEATGMDLDAEPRGDPAQGD